MELLKEFAPRNLDAQSLSVQSSPGELIYRNGQLPDRLIETAYPDANTLYALFRRSVRMYPNRNFLGQRPVIEGAPTTTTTAGTAAPAQTRGPYVWETFKQVSERVNNFGSALVSFGCKPGDKIGIYSKNKPEWIVTTEACNSHSLVAVAIYDTFGPDIIEYVINHAELKGIVVSSDCISKVTSLLGKCPTVKFVIQMEPKNPTDDAKCAETCAKNNIIFSLFKDAEAKGKENPAPHTPPKPDTLAVLMYTSGTTALPKGVMHKHSNLVATAAGVAATLGGITHEDTYISYLPLAHILEREAIIAMTGAGAAVGFYQGDITKLTEDIQALKPTLMCGVPRVFDRIHSKVKERIASGSWVSRWMFDYAYSVKKDAASKGLGTPILDYLVFSKLKGALGGNMRLICSGGAPLSAATQEFIKLCFCCPIVQGYGLTETCAAGCVTLPDDPTLGHTGPPIACAELKLVDVPEMNYLTSSNPPTGEVCIRGPCVSSGYYKDPEKTAQEFESTGWFHTGDIGRMNPNGTLSIIDRKKNIFKLAQGEYVAAEKLELVYNQSKLVVSTFVYGDSLQSVLVAIIVPNRNSLEAWAATNNIKYEGGWEGLCAHPEAKKAILADLSQLAKKNNLMGFEAIKAVYLHPNEFTIDEDFITPTMKLKRPQLKKAFQGKIDAMYADLSTAAMSIGN